MRGATLVVGACVAALLLHVVFATEETDEEFATVRVAQGQLKGRRVVTKTGGAFYSFQGVPYATPPVGPLRFQMAQPSETWEGVREALKEGPSCPQIELVFTNSYLGEEDCLYLNIYTPKLPGTNATDIPSLPVMVWIHGGGLRMGSGNSDLYGPDYLVNEDVILVTINYRLGTLGFLSLEDESVPANLGLKDQVAALRWVHDNIHKFGGDPMEVTIFGESSGGLSVHYHMMSPMSKGLFHRAIAQSGCALNPWAMGNKPRKAALLLAKELGYNDSDSKGLFHFLKSVPARDMVEAYTKVGALQAGEHISYFGPIIETNVDDSKEIFLTADVRESLENGSYPGVPSIFGFNSQEGILALVFTGFLKNTSLSTFNENSKTILEKFLESKGNLKTQKERILELYFGNNTISKTPLQRLVDFLSDSWFISGIDRTVKLLADDSKPVYYYQFAFYGKNNFYMNYLNITTLPGATHLDELAYLFKMTLPNMDLEVKPETPELLTQKRLVKLWTNFAKTSNPTPKFDETVQVEWPAYSKENPAYLNIDTELSVEKNIYKGRMDFWNSL